MTNVTPIGMRSDAFRDLTMTNRSWRLSSQPVPFPEGGSVLARPDTYFLNLSFDTERGCGLIWLLDQEPEVSPESDDGDDSDEVHAYGISFAPIAEIDDLPDELYGAFEHGGAGYLAMRDQSREGHREERNAADLDALAAFLARIPGIDPHIGQGTIENDRQHGNWWVKFRIDAEHPLAWHVVQNLGHVLNYFSLNDRLPTVFKPVSGPPDLNPGPKEYLSWVIESTDAAFTPELCRSWLEDNLPAPVDDLSAWTAGEDEDEPPNA
jgi:hypothetical protein